MILFPCSFYTKYNVCKYPLRKMAAFCRIYSVKGHFSGSEMFKKNLNCWGYCFLIIFISSLCWWHRGIDRGHIAVVSTLQWTEPHLRFLYYRLGVDAMISKLTTPLWCWHDLNSGNFSYSLDKLCSKWLWKNVTLEDNLRNSLWIGKSPYHQFWGSSLLAL